MKYPVFSPDEPRFAPIIELRNVIPLVDAKGNATKKTK